MKKKMNEPNKMPQQSLLLYMTLNSHTEYRYVYTYCNSNSSTIKSTNKKRKQIYFFII